ncbi:MAG: DUF4142 domain-containing protein [Verrucomicrobiaceae bacterium]|nr:DUF4142 domain-containing protein [Verrucomicrobiaceae bacterium]
MTFLPHPLAGSALALGAFLLLAPPSHSAEKSEPLSPVDARFIQEEAAAGKAIAKIADEAAARSESAKVRAFARVLVRDHRESSAALAAFAKSRAVDLASGDMERHKAHFDQLREEKGPDFDSAFIDLMVRMHKDRVENFEKTATDSPDAELKKWAGATLPKLQSHLKTAKELSPSQTASAAPPHFIVL